MDNVVQDTVKLDIIVASESLAFVQFVRVTTPMKHPQHCRPHVEGPHTHTSAVVI